MSPEQTTKDEAEQVQSEESKQAPAEELNSELEDSQLEQVAGGTTTESVPDLQHRHGGGGR